MKFSSSDRHYAIATFAFLCLILVVNLITAVVNRRQHFERSVLSQEISDLRLRVEKIEGKQ